MTKKIRRGLLLALLPLSLLIAFVAWAYASPLGASPDDDYHMSSIWCGGGLDDLCSQGTTEERMRVPSATISASACFAFSPGHSGLCQVPLTNDLEDTDRGNFTGDYPPVFYATMSIFSGSDINVSVLSMRILNGTLFVIMLSLVVALSPRHRKMNIAWAVFVSLVPLGMFIIPSVNPSSWTVTSAALLWLTLVGYLQATQAWRSIALAVVAIILTLMGVGSRGDSAVYTVIAVLVSLILAFKVTRANLLKSILHFLISSFSVLMFFSSGQSAAADPSKVLPENVLNHAFHVFMNLPELWAGALGFAGLGWLDTKLPGSTWVASIVVFGAFAFWGLREMGWRKLLAVSGVAASLILVPAYILIKDGVLVGDGVQPRYIYPLMAMFVGVCLFHKARGNFWPSRLQLAVAAVSLSIANAAALHVNLRRYLTGVNNPSINLNNSVEWWWPASVMPFSPLMLWVIGSLSFAIAAVALVLISRQDGQLGGMDSGFAGSGLGDSAKLPLRALGEPPRASASLTRRAALQGTPPPQK